MPPVRRLDTKLALSLANRLLARYDAALVRSSTARSQVGEPPHLRAARVDPAEHRDLNRDTLHRLRTDRLRAMPPGAEVVLSAGCSGLWYFDWLDGAYPGIRRHIGVEAFLPRPPILPDRIEWQASSVGAMDGVASGSVDLVFSGQNIEHLWPDEVVGFLSESHRVLQPGGHLVVDSPNRWVCDALNFLQPEHLAELTPSEAVTLLARAGFDDVVVHGLWLCFDRDTQTLLPLEPNRILDGWTADRRAAITDRPEDSFLWWAEATRADRPVDRPGLERAVGEIFEQAYTHRLDRYRILRGDVAGRGRHRLIRVPAGAPGPVVVGPSAPLRAGSHTIRVVLRAGPAPRADAEVARVDVHVPGAGGDGEVVAERRLTSGDLPLDRFAAIELPVHLDTTRFGVEIRVHTAGTVPITTGFPRLLDRP